MIISDQVAPVEKFGEVLSNPIDYQIHNTRKAFEVLSSKLYKNKILAIIREISCNAYDSHVEFDKTDLPFDVHLPNEFEPWFSIRDYGRGMDDNTIRSVFTHFFKSTKETSNDYIGALGLGAKSPFSYVDSFIVTSFVNGARHTYECYKENGLPNMQLRSSVTSNEDTGIEVSIPVKAEDFNTFFQHAEQVYKWFDVKPNINLSKFTHATPKFANDWCVSDSITAIMGQVAYPIDTKIVGDHNLKKIAIKFPIGALDVQAGREELSYDPVTISVIQKKMTEIHDNIQKQYADDFAAFTNILGAVKHYQDNQNKYQVCVPVFRGWKLDTHNIYKAITQKYGSKTIDQFGYTTAVDLNQAVVFYNNCVKHRAKFLKWRKENPKAFGIQIVGSSTAPIPEFEGCQPVYSRDISIDRKPTRFRQASRGDPRSCVEINVSPDDDVKYILVKNFVWCDSKGEPIYSYSEDSRTKITGLLRTYGTVIYIPWSMKHKIQPHWENGLEFLKVEFKRLFANKEMRNRLNRAVCWKHFEDMCIDHAMSKFYCLGDYPNTNFGKKLETILMGKSDYQELSQWVAYGRNTIDDKNQYMDMWDDLMKEYPLVKNLILAKNIPNIKIAFSELYHYIKGKEVSHDSI
jgi:hypothetical protein